MFIIHEQDRIQIQTFEPIDALFSFSDVEVLKKYGVKVNRDLEMKMTIIKIRMDISNEALGEIMKIILKNYWSMR